MASGRSSVEANPRAHPGEKTEVSEKIAGASGNSRNYLLRHWRGECSLGTAYWLNGTLFANLFSGLMLVLADQLAKGSHSLRLLAAVGVATIGLALAAWLWSVVGIWRSADRHVTRGGKSFWATAAKVTIVLGAIGMAGRLSSFILPEVKELTLISLGRDPIGQFDIKVSNDGKSVVVTGTLREGAAAAVKRILDAVPGATFLTLNSNGGRLLEAQEIAREVRSRGLGTYVDYQCLSACTLVFLAGKDRAATPNAKLGFHQPSFSGLDAQAQAYATQEMMETYRRAGLPEDFRQRISETPPTKMWYPTRDELITANVITRTSLGDESTITGAWQRSKAEMELWFRQQPYWQSIERRFPDTIRKAVNEGWAVHEHGGTDADVMNATRGVVASMWPQLMSVASNDILDAYVHLLVDEMRAARSISADACQRLLDSKLDITKTLPKELVKREMALMTQALAAPPYVAIKAVTPAQERRIFAMAIAKLPARYVQVIATPADFANQPGLVCDSMIGLYEAIGSLSTEDRHVALGSMFRSGNEQ